VAEPAHLRLHDVLASTARELVTHLGADACTISRVIGDVLIFVAEATTSGRTLQLGQGFLVSDFPETQAMLADGRPRLLTLTDEDIDASEEQLLRELGFGALLMLRLDLGGLPWGLVEVYREEPRTFVEADARRAGELLALIRLPAA
jgi:transcriptional regulator with GAF, ATPase, and Fis domain